ncbi:hypothetical protein BGZ46_006377, partial [Entomortierella lignicola]
SGFTDQFFCITEQNLLMALRSNAPILHKNAISQMFWNTQKLAEKHVASHPGDILYDLFFHSGLEYYRNTLLIHPETANEQTRFRHGGKRRFLQLNQEDRDEFKELAQNLRDNPNQTTKTEFREFVKGQLNDPEENKIEIDESFSGYQKGGQRRNRRYVLTGTMVTNGYELKLLAYSLTKPKPPSNPVPNTTQFKLRSILTEFSHSAEVNAAFPQDHYIVAGIDPGIHSTATATILDSDT